MALDTARFESISGLTYDSEVQTFYGIMNGYPVSLTLEGKKRCGLVISCRGESQLTDMQRDAMTKERLLELPDEYRYIGFRIPAENPEQQLAAQLEETVADVTADGKVPCCEKCGREGQFPQYYRNNRAHAYCPRCWQQIRIKREERTPAAEMTLMLLPVGIAATAVFFASWMDAIGVIVSTIAAYNGIMFASVARLGKQLRRLLLLHFAVCMLSAVISILLHAEQGAEQFRLILLQLGAIGSGCLAYRFAYKADFRSTAHPEKLLRRKL